jgi:hypothetical protein
MGVGVGGGLRRGEVDLVAVSVWVSLGLGYWGGWSTGLLSRSSFVGRCRFGGLVCVVLVGLGRWRAIRSN